MQLNDLDLYALEDIESSDHPSDFIKRENYFILILRLPYVNKDIKIKSYAYLIEKDAVYTYNREQKSIEKFGTLSHLQQLLEKKIEKLIQAIKEYHINIDQLEETLLDEKNESDFMQKWLQYKKDVSLINRLMFHAAIVIELFVSYIKKEYKEGFDTHAFDDLREETARVRDLAKAAVEKLDYLYDFYRAKVDEKMNTTVYYLTIISAIFLPLTLVTGFFGMNTGGLPYTEDSLGTWKVIGISLVLEVLFLIPFIYITKGKRA